MIAKRYQYWGSENGIPVLKWSKWFNYCEDDNALSRFRSEEKYQLISSGLKNEFKIV